MQPWSLYYEILLLTLIGGSKNPEDLKNQLEGMMGKMGIDLSKLGLDDSTKKPKESELD